MPKVSESRWPVERVSKLDVAHRQLCTAIRLFFEEGDSISTYTLAAASHEIFRALVKFKGGASMIKDSDFIKPEHQKEYEDFINEPQNFFKHGARDPNKTLDFKPQSMPFWILDCIMMGAKFVDHCSTRESILFQYWFIAEYPHLLKPGVTDPIPKDIRQLIKSTGNSKGLFRMVLKKPERYPITNQICAKRMP